LSWGSSMCSVVGYIGDRLSRSYVLEGLARLEYRGYDSAGFVCFDQQNGQFQYVKTTGGIDNLILKMERTPIDGFVGLGHTRWATHGVSTELNAHPHFNIDKTISVVHNGIVENYGALKETLQAAGHHFYSDTDTEVIAHVLDEAYNVHHDLFLTVYQAVHQLRGAYACAALFQKHPEVLVVIRKSSPLCIGVGTNEMFVASDITAFSGYTKQVLFLPDESFALVTKKSIELYAFSGKKLPLTFHAIEDSWQQCSKEGFEHYMLKEIYEQKRVVYDTLSYCHIMGQQTWKRSGLDEKVIADLERIIFFACGTSSYAADIACTFFRKICGIHATSLLSSEYRYCPFIREKNTLYCAISQSGETADTLEVLCMIAGLQMPTLAITNVPSSSMVREAQGFLLTQAKKEIAVASTKSFVAQLALLFWFAHKVALQKNILSMQDLQTSEQDLLVAAEVMENCMERYKFSIIERHAPFYAQFKNFIFLGRAESYALAREAALKLKEIAYCFVDCYPAGELKHGPIALIDEHVPVFIFSVLDELVYQKLASAAQEIKARRGHLVVFAFEGQKELIDLADTAFVIPRVNPLLGPLAMTGLMQLLVYHIAHILGRPIDKPRNLAKSVTVE
jgi:glutamine---fructose-6-phosphate transaminase (isomerizing)